MIGFACKPNNEPPIFQLGNRVCVRKRNHFSDRFQNWGLPIQNGLCYISRPQMVGLCCSSVDERSVDEAKYMLPDR
jgi:hypothetical protein